MGERERGRGRLGSLTIAVLACATLALAAPGGAGAAAVVNGDFETGNLNGWSVHRTMEVGNWFAYRGRTEPIADQRGKKLQQAPPQGEYAAISDELNPETLILSQEISLGAGLSHRLSLLAYYDSAVPLAVPSPDTLAVADEALGGQANQQFRIDVMRAGTPLESLDPADILRTVFSTQPGDPQDLSPTRLSADLSPFAGQTVRLRIAVAAGEEVLAAGIDDVAVESSPLGKAPGNAPGKTPGKAPGQGGQGAPTLRSDGFRIGRPKLNRKNGTATLAVDVAGPGSVAAKTAKHGKLIAPTAAKAAKAGTVTLRLKPTASARATLKRKHKLQVEVEVTFNPSGGSPRSATVPVLLKLAASAPHRR